MAWTYSNSWTITRSGNWFRKASSGRYQVAGSTNGRGPKLQIASDHAWWTLSQQGRGSVHLPYAISERNDKMSKDPATYINIYALEALDTVRCMQLMTVELRTEVCDDRARSKASNVFSASCFLSTTRGVSAIIAFFLDKK